MAAPALTPGAPGLYWAPAARVARLTRVRMDVCGFVGVAPRGPARMPVPRGRRDPAPPTAEPPRRRSVAVPVESFDEYVRLYGGFDGPGRLPYVVASFFEQGGRRAHVVRIVHDTGDAGRGPGTARATLKPFAAPAAGVELWASSEGEWGNGLRAELSFARRPIHYTAIAGDELTVPVEVAPQVGTLLRLSSADGTADLRFVVESREQGDPTGPGRHRVLRLDLVPTLTTASVEVVDATFEVDDGDGRAERHDHVGVAPPHPRFIARVLLDESQLVEPDATWAETVLTPADTDLPAAATWMQTAPGEYDREPLEGGFTGGEDRFHEIVHDDFFDDAWTLGDDEPGAGVHVFAEPSEVAVVVVPDVYDADPLMPVDDIRTPASFAGARFRRCVHAGVGDQAAPTRGLERLALDPTVGADRRTIVALQRRLHDLAELLHDWVVLLDVPPRLGQREILRWRAEFDSAFAAAFHPWPRVARSDDSRGGGVLVNPSAVAAGIVARREIADGVQTGPANVLAVRVVDVEDRVSASRHDELHPAGVNVFIREADGVRLTAARTLARDVSYRQLSVRRLVSMLERALVDQLAWVTFEPNNPTLWAHVEQTIEAYLRELYLDNAFAGETEEEAFFVRCDETLNAPEVLDAGQLRAEIGVAPAEPLEFIVLHVARDGDGTLIVEGRR